MRASLNDGRAYPSPICIGGLQGAGPPSLILVIHATLSPLATWAGLSVLRILVAPLLALTFLVCTVLSPHRSSRFAFLAASVMEAAVSAYVGFVWFVPLFFDRP